MSETHGHKHGVPSIVRIYAAVPIIIVLYLSYMAINYLVMQLMVPRDPPQQITGIPVRLTAEVWQTQPSQFMGIQVAESPRAPLAHYHQIEGWFQPDPRNDCTTSGCHSSLPHNAEKESRAFLNMHATSMHCGVCHLKSDREPLPLVWYDLESGAPTDPPALLQLYGWINSEEGRAAFDQPTAAVQDRLVGLLSTATAQAGGDPSLARLRDQVAAIHYTSYLFPDAVANVRARLKSHLRGEYGAKLALRDAGGSPRLAHADTADAARELRALDPEADATQREALVTAVHPQRRAETLDCIACHTTEHALVELQSVGYPPVRINELRGGWVFRAIQHMRDGQTFIMPRFIGNGGGGGVLPSAAPTEQE